MITESTKDKVCEYKYETEYLISWYIKEWFRERWDFWLKNRDSWFSKETKIVSQIREDESLRFLIIEKVYS